MVEKPGLFPNLVFSLASGEQLDEVLAVRRTIYTEELGYHGVDEFDQRARHIVAASENGQVVAACRLLGPDVRPLEIESFLDLASLLGPSSRPAQIGGLWILPSRRSIKDGMLPLALMRCAYLLANRLGASDIVLRTHIATVRPLYLRAGFVEHPDVGFLHPLWGDVYVMSMNLVALRQDALDSTDALKRFIVGGHLANVDLAG